MIPLKFERSRTVNNLGSQASQINQETLAHYPKINIQGNTATASNRKLDLKI